MSTQRPAPRLLTVLAKRQLSPHLLRITLGGEAMADFPKDQASAYVKLIWPSATDPRAVVRTYTIRAQRETELDIDFVLHHDQGPASLWAQQVCVGETILVGGPGGKKLIHLAADYFVLAGDMTALPALCVNLETLPANAQGHCFIEVLSAEDIQPLIHPKGIQLHWLVNAEPGLNSTLLKDALASIAYPSSTISLWAACEFSSMRAIRAWARDKLDVRSPHVYISSYWKLGASEDQHKVSKREDAQEHDATERKIDA